MTLKRDEAALDGLSNKNLHTVARLPDAAAPEQGTFPLSLTGELLSGQQQKENADQHTELSAH